MTRFRTLVACLCLLAMTSAASAIDLEQGNDPADLLPADQAFILGTERQADRSLVLHWTIAPDYYLYRDRMEFELVDAGGATLGEPAFAPATTKQDPFFGETAVYYGEGSVRLPLQGEPSADASLELVYQGCNEPHGVCYPPIERTLALASFGSAGGGGPPVSEQGRIAAALTSTSIAWTALVFVGFGLLLTFTPCVFPMVPILVGVISGERERGTHIGRAAFLSTVFVLFMALTYAAVGVAIGLTGASLQAWFQQPPVIVLFAGVFVLLALATFGLFHLQTPHGLRHWLERHTGRLGGTVSGAALLGVTSAVIVSPCVTPPLIGALLYIAQTGDPVTGGIALFALGIGMGIPLLIVGACAGHLLPRAGAWMQPIRIALGIGLLAVAIWLLDRILPITVTMALWAVLLIGTAVQLGALSAARGALARTWKALGVVLLLYGVLLLVGAAGGGQSVLQPLRGVFSDGPPAAAGRDFRPVDGLSGLRQALSEAQARGQPVMLDVYADWCVACKELEAFTFPDANVRRALGDTLLLRADVTANDAGDQALLQRFDLYGPPAVLFFGPDGVERRGGRLVGFIGPGPFARHVREVLPEAAS
jgi:thiol:disulfide interchange protein DsbD